MARRGFLTAATGTTWRDAAALAEERHPPVGGFVTAEGLRIHFVDLGAGPAVVLIHGASGNLRDFTFSLAPRLARAGLRVVAFDRPGLGYSARAPEMGWEPAVQARVLRAAAAALGLRRPVVLGHSWGGAVAMAWAVQAPDELRGVASLAGATHPWGGAMGVFYRLAATDLVGGMVGGIARLVVDPEKPEGLLAGVFRPNPCPEGYAAHVGVGLALRPATLRHNAEDLVHLNAALTAQAPRYRGLTVPVEAVHGAEDTTVWPGLHAEPLAAAVAEGRLTLLPGVGHMPHHAAEDETVAAVLRLAER